MSRTFFGARTALFIGVTLATVAGTALIMPQGALADDCLLDTNGTGSAEQTMDTDGGASSSNDDARLDCGVAASAAEMLALSSKLGALENDLDGMEERFRRGIAATVAMTPVQIPSEPGRFTYAINGSVYRGAYATGGSMMYRLNTRNPMAIGFGFSKAGGKDNAVRFGVAGEF